jgi:hypothetical protein
MVRSGWWTIPGPARFVSTVAQTTIEKTVCLLLLPDYTPASLREAVDADLADRLDCATVLVDASECGEMNPGEALLRLKLGVKTPASADYIGELLENSAFAGSAYWVEGLDEQSWPRWRSFFEEYTRRLPRASTECAYFIVALTPASGDPGFSAMDATNGDPIAAARHVDVARIGVLVYSGVVHPEDMLYYASQRLVEMGWRLRTSLERSIVVAVAASVAGCDPLTCDALLTSGSAEAVCAPQDTLLSLRSSRGWEADIHVSWGLGTQTWRPDGRRVPHPALMSNGHVSVDELVWRGQVAVLMPMLEVARRFYAQKYEGQISPDEVAERHNGDKSAVIEFGDIVDILGHRQLGDTEYWHLWDLRKLRNDVAHSRSVSFERIEECLSEGGYLEGETRQDG